MAFLLGGALAHDSAEGLHTYFSIITLAALGLAVRLKQPPPNPRTTNHPYTTT